MLKKALLLVGLVMALVSGSEAGAVVGKLTIQNDSNRHIWCAFTAWDAAGSKWITVSWWKIDNGQVGTFNNVTYYRCEEEGNPEVAWHNKSGQQRPFCAPRGSNHVSPYHKADDYQLCVNSGREWRMFGLLPNQATYTKFINP